MVNRMFKRIAKLMLWLALTVAPLMGQSTSVTLNVSDADGQAWANGAYTANLYSPPGVPGFPYFRLGTTTAVPNQNQAGNLDGAGSAALTFTPNASIAPAGTKWQFVVCPNSSTAPCFTQTVTIAGASQTVTVNAPAMRIGSGPSPNVRAYTDLEVNGSYGSMYYNVLDNTYHVCQQLLCAGSGWGKFGSSSVLSGVIDPWLDVRTLGVDCTGAADASSLLNALTSAVDGLTSLHLSTRGCQKILLANQWVIHGSEFAEIDFGGTIGQGGVVHGGTRFTGCPAADVSDAMISIDRSGYMNLHGGTAETKGSGCTHGFQGGIKFSNTASGGYNSTRNTVSDMFITPSVSGFGVTNWYALKIENTPNQEGFGFHHLYIHCQRSAGSVGIWSTDGNADSTVLDRESDIESCYRGVQMDAGSMTVRDSHISGNGGYVLFGSIGGGATIYENGGCVSIIDHIIVAESSGPFLYNTRPGGCNHLFSGNTISFQDPDPTLYPINVDGGIQTFFQNDFTGGGVPTTIKNNALVDGDGNTEFGSQGQIIDLGGNNLRNNGNAAAYLWSFHVWQLGGAYLSASNPLGTAGSQLDWALGPDGMNGGQPSDGGGHASYSPALIFSRKLWNFGTSHANAFDRFTWRSVGIVGGAPTLALGYTQGAGWNVTPELAFGVTASGMTHGASAQAVTPSLSTFGTPGGTSYSYVMVGIAGCGHSAPTSTATIATGPTTLSTSNGIIVKSNYTAGNWAYDIYRTAGGATTGKIGRVLATDIFANGDDFSTVGIKDTGLTGDGTTPPTGDTSGCITQSNATALNVLSPLTTNTTAGASSQMYMQLAFAWNGQTLNPGAIPANSCVDVSLGSPAGVIISGSSIPVVGWHGGPPAGWAGIQITGFQTNVAGAMGVRSCNVTTGAITPPSTTVDVRILF